MTTITQTLRALALLLLLSLLSAACGGGTSDEDQAFIDAVATGVGENAPDGIDQGCFAEELVGALGGASGMEERGLTVEEFAAGDEFGTKISEQDARSIADGIWGCDGLSEAFFGDIMDTDDAERISCASDIVDDDLLKSALASGFLVDEAAEAIEAEIGDEFESQIVEAMSSC